MNLADCAAVLAKCAAFDRRTVGDSDILAWYEVLATVEVADALEAVTRWYTTNRDWIMPSDVRKLARDINQERIREETARIVPELTPPANLVPLTDRSAELQAKYRQLYNALPPGKREHMRRNLRSPRKAD